MAKYDFMDGVVDDLESIAYSGRRFFDAAADRYEAAAEANEASGNIAHAEYCRGRKLESLGSAINLMMQSMTVRFLAAILKEHSGEPTDEDLRQWLESNHPNRPEA